MDSWHAKESVYTQYIFSYIRNEEMCWKITSLCSFGKKYCMLSTTYPLLKIRVQRCTGKSSCTGSGFFDRLRTVYPQFSL